MTPEILLIRDCVKVSFHFPLFSLWNINCKADVLHNKEFCETSARQKPIKYGSFLVFSSIVEGTKRSQENWTPAQLQKERRDEWVGGWGMGVGKIESMWTFHILGSDPWLRPNSHANLVPRAISAFSCSHSLDNFFRDETTERQCF